METRGIASGTIRPTERLLRSRRAFGLGHLVLVVALTPFVGGGAHCGYTNYLGPTVRQPVFRGGAAASAPRTTSVRVHRAKPDYKSARVAFPAPTSVTVRSCDPVPRTITAFEGIADVPIAGTCVEIVFADPGKAVQFEIVTDIEREVVLQGNCSPHGSPFCLHDRDLAPGTTVGSGDESWTLWKIDATPPPASP